MVRIRGLPHLGKQVPVTPLVAPDSLKVAGDQDSRKFAVAWASGKRILGLLFDADERPGPIFRIDGPEPGRPTHPVLALSPGASTMLVLWEQETADRDVDIWGRISTDRGRPSGDEFRVNRATAGAQTLPQLTATRSGFFAAWRSVPSGPSGDPSGTELRGVAISALRGELGGELRVNRDPIGSQDNPTVTLDEHGNCVVGWLREGAEINGLFLRTLRGCEDDGPAEQAVRVFRDRPIRTPRLFHTAGATGIVYGVVEGDGGIGVETVKDSP